jgi:hypothetical protein
MQQNGIELPRRRVELYTVLTQVLLERRNALRGLPVVPEIQATQRLGPIAYQMQATKNSFATRNDVLAAFSRTIQQIDHVPLEQAQQEAVIFLERVRERGGIFVLRTGNYYGFFHRTFQEYFVARHILRSLETDPQAGIDNLLQKARQQNDVWREPFLLAVAYQTSNEAAEVWDIIRQLLNLPQGADNQQRAHDTLLAGECLLEAKESTVPHDLECDIVLALLDVYGDAQLTKTFEVCRRVEEVMQHLLLNLSREAEHSALLLTIQETIHNSQCPLRQRVVLTLFTIIAQDIHQCAPVVFKKIVPPMLGLAGLPEVGEFQPSPPMTTSDLDNIDLALANLSFLGAHGPAGASLDHVCPRLEPYLPLLAEYSLQSGVLITPTIVPLGEANYRGYEEAVGRWQRLWNNMQKSKQAIPTPQEKRACIIIHQDLLKCAEETCYPAEMHLLHMLERSQIYPDQPWQVVWQNYLQEQMSTGTYLTYQTCASLWATLFPIQKDQQALAATLLEHWYDDAKPQRQAQRFFLCVIEDFRNLRDMRKFRDFSKLSNLLVLRELREIRDLRGLKYLKYFRYLRYLRYFGYLRHAEDLETLRGLRYMNNLRDLSYLRDLKHLKYVINLRETIDLRDLRDLLLTEKVRIEAEQRLSTCSFPEQVELLTLLLGRVLYIHDSDEEGIKSVEEIKRILRTALPFIQAEKDAREVVLDIVRCLPARTEQEVVYILDLAQSTQDEDLKEAYLEALRYSSPVTDGAWAALEKGGMASDPAIREVVRERFLQNS